MLQAKIKGHSKGHFGGATVGRPKKGVKGDSDDEGKGKKAARGRKPVAKGRGEDLDEDDAQSELGGDWDGKYDNDDYDVRG